MDITKKVGRGEEEDVAEIKPKRQIWKKLRWLMVAALVAVFVVWGWSQVAVPSWGKAYQAVFLVNGQVYFGKLTNLNANFATLKDVFYILINQPLQPVEKNQPQPPPQFILTKLGLQEIHGPKDEMMINRNQILFVEDLRDDSQVIQGIEQFKKSRG